MTPIVNKSHDKFSILQSRKLIFDKVRIIFLYLNIWIIKIVASDKKWKYRKKDGKRPNSTMVVFGMAALLSFLSGQVTYPYFDCESNLWIESKEVISLIKSLRIIMVTVSRGQFWVAMLKQQCLSAILSNASLFKQSLFIKKIKP